MKIKNIIYIFYILIFSSVAYAQEKPFLYSQEHDTDWYSRMQRIDTTTIFHYPVLEIKNKNLIQILDSIILMSSNCNFDSNYTVFYSIRISVNSDNKNTFIEISAINSTAFIKDMIGLTGNTPPLYNGLFYYKNNLFMVGGCWTPLKSLFDSIFNITEKTAGVKVDKSGYIRRNKSGFINTFDNLLKYIVDNNNFILIKKNECNSSF